MSPRGIGATVFAAALVLAVPGRAVAAVVPGTAGATTFAAANQPEAEIPPAVFGDSGGPSAPDDSGSELPTPPAAADAPPPRAADWLADPPHPARHNLWVPTVEWATCLTLTIPLFMIDPGFVNVGPVSADTFVKAWTEPPDWDDGDGFVANYILHPFMGAEAYLTVRNRDYGPLTSFLFSTGVSVAWEYLIEAWVQQPSAIDLVTTSPIGSLMGEARFQMRRRIAEWSPSTGRDALLVLVDPVEALHRYIGKRFMNGEDDAPDGTLGSALNFGPDQANLRITLRY